MSSMRGSFLGGTVRARHIDRRSACERLPALAAPILTDHGGAVLSSVDIMEFYPAEWQGGVHNPTDNIGGRARIQLSSSTPYLRPASRDYRGAGSDVKFVGNNRPAPQVSFTNPFTVAQVEAFVRALDLQVRPSDPAATCGLVPCLYMPIGWKFEQPEILGFHSYVTKPGEFLPYMVLTCDGLIDDLTAIFSHQLVETVTDPTADGFRVDGPGCGEGGGWCEVADVCGGTGIFAGVVVSAYYSASAGQCIIPTS